MKGNGFTRRGNMPKPSLVPHFFFSFGWWLSLLAEVVLWMGAASAVFRSFLPLQPSAAPVLVCVHQGSPYSVLTHLIPSLITWSVWFFLLPPNLAMIFKHETHTYTQKDSKEKTWPKQLVLIENRSLGKAQWWCQNPAGAGVGEGILGLASAQHSRSWEYFS